MSAASALRRRVGQALSPLGLKGIQIDQQEIIVEEQNALPPWTKDSAVGEFSHVRCQLQKLICPLKNVSSWRLDLMYPS